ncbi:arginyl-tRNA synthetase [Sphaeroforma arctica JP610]|uniref:arginine--tRNA ligase n=1 Tax=Sphaeroforma arctica JP610 TaxID=667725 RepID=A0A0L0FSI5_9EUKA|nr:arginyl-tRNA synthetase [Sphaeroforma arctica JP610]KNC79730.1 arginyl-tRNA synthetase [Sphaeroforma arctica JP610]|eukprot:XP_014153632.1 arginyl-tRNA synthetase [Sphaeroforma arctica JP610]
MSKAEKKAAKLAGVRKMDVDPRDAVRTPGPERTSPATMDASAETEYMIDVFGHIKAMFETATASAFPLLANSPVALVLSTKPGAHYQNNSAMSLYSKSKDFPADQFPADSPMDAAMRLCEHLPSSDVVEKAEAVKGSTIAVIVSTKYLTRQMNLLFQLGARPPKVKEEVVVVDYSSPNIAKQMHVGHLRSTIIGDCISNLFEFIGHKVHRINHVGDWGTQFGMLIAHLKDEYPDFETNSPPIADLQAFYQGSKKRFDADEEFKTRAWNEVVLLQNGDPVVTKAWQLICAASRKEFDVIYNRLNIVGLREMGESFYQSMMVDVIKHFEERGLVTIEDGRKLVFLEGKEVPITIEKSNGSYTYDTSDLACLKYRLDTLKADSVIYVVDAGQSLHFELVWGAARKAEIYDETKNRIEHVAFGLVLGEDKKKLKTRSGDTIKLSELLDEAVELSSKVVDDKQATLEDDAKLTAQEREDAINAIAYGAVKYADLKSNRTADYVFSFDRMLDFRGNTAVYLLYAYTRIMSIARKAGVSEADMAADTTPIVLEHPKEIKLALHLLRFPEIIEQFVAELNPHVVCGYMFQASQYFTEFYENCRCTEVVDRKVVSYNMSRIKLTRAVAVVLAKCFDILGMKYVQRM